MVEDHKTFEERFSQLYELVQAALAYLILNLTESEDKSLKGQLLKGQLQTLQKSLNNQEKHNQTITFQFIELKAIVTSLSKSFSGERKKLYHVEICDFIKNLTDQIENQFDVWDLTGSAYSLKQHRKVEEDFDKTLEDIIGLYGVSDTEEIDDMPAKFSSIEETLLGRIADYNNRLQSTACVAIDNATDIQNAYLQQGLIIKDCCEYIREKHRLSADLIVKCAQQIEHTFECLWKKQGVITTVGSRSHLDANVVEQDKPDSTVVGWCNNILAFMQEQSIVLLQTQAIAFTHNSIATDRMEQQLEADKKTIAALQLQVDALQRSTTNTPMSSPCSSPLSQKFFDTKRVHIPTRLPKPRNNS